MTLPFLSVRQPALYELTGWTVKVLDHATHQPLMSLPNFMELDLTVELNGLGGGVLVLSLDDLSWQQTLPNGKNANPYLLDHEHIFQVYDDGVLRGEWLGESVEESEVEESEARQVTISGPGTAKVLEWAKVFNSGYPTSPNAQWYYGDIGAMDVWHDLLRRAQLRGTIPFVQPTFQKYVGSDGRAFQELHMLGPIQPEVGSSLLVQLNTLTGQNLDEPSSLRADWIMRPGFQLDVSMSIGVRRPSVIFFEGEHEKTRSRTRSRENVENFVLLRDNEGRYSTSVVGESVANFGQRESVMQVQAAENTALRQRMADIQAQRTADEADNWTLQIEPYREGRKIFQDYGPGDWVGVSRWRPGQDPVVETVRITAITAQVDDSGNVNAELTFLDTYEMRQRSLQQQLTETKNIVNQINMSYAYNDTFNTINNITNNPELPTNQGWGASDFQLSDSQLGQLETALGTGGVRVFFGKDEPAEANPGDFWLQTKE